MAMSAVMVHINPRLPSWRLRTSGQACHGSEKVNDFFLLHCVEGAESLAKDLERNTNSRVAQLVEVTREAGHIARSRRRCCLGRRSRGGVHVSERNTANLSSEALALRIMTTEVVVLTPKLVLRTEIRNNTGTWKLRETHSGVLVSYKTAVWHQHHANHEEEQCRAASLRTNSPAKCASRQEALEHVGSSGPCQDRGI